MFEHLFKDETIKNDNGNSSNVTNGENHFQNRRNENNQINNSGHNQYSGRVDISNSNKGGVMDEFGNAMNIIKKKVVFTTKNILVYVLGFGLIFFVVYLLTTDNNFVKEIYWKLGGGNKELSQLQDKIEVKTKEINEKTALLKRLKEEASGEFLKLQGTEVKIKDSREKISTLSKEIKDLQDSVNTIVNSNVIKNYEGDNFYTINEKGTPTDIKNYNGDATISSGSVGTSNNINSTNTGSVDNKEVIKELLKRVQTKNLK